MQSGKDRIPVPVNCHICGGQPRFKEEPLAATKLTYVNCQNECLDMCILGVDLWNKENWKLRSEFLKECVIHGRSVEKAHQVTVKMFGNFTAWKVKVE